MNRALAFAALLCPLAVSQDSRKAPTDAEVREAIAAGTKLLVAGQENYVETRAHRTTFPNEEAKKEYEARIQAEEAKKSAAIGAPREWPYEGVYRLGPVIPPGYRAGGTAIVCWGLLEAPGFDADKPRREAFDRGIAYLCGALEHDPLLSNGFEGTYDVRGWAHAYGLRVLLRGLERKVFDEAAAKRATGLARTLVRTLADTEIPKRGGWSYSRPGANRPCAPSTFMTAPTLQALFQAQKQGFDVPAGVVDRGLKALEVGRLESGSFQYVVGGTKTGEGIEDLPGACARMAVCETTLLLAGRGSVDRVRGAVKAFFDGWEWLEKRRKQLGTHEGPYGIAPYFFHYGHTYVAQAIEQLPEAERPPLREQLRILYWRTREKDGGWNDRQFPRSEGYGTAMAILGLLMPELPPPAPWVSKTAPASQPAPESKPLK